MHYNTLEEVERVADIIKNACSSWARDTLYIDQQQHVKKQLLYQLIESGFFIVFGAVILMKELKKDI